MSDMLYESVNKSPIKNFFFAAKLKHSSVVPLYIQLKKAIREEILRGYYQKNQPLPAIAIVAKSNSISKSTVEKAYRELQRDGFVCRVKGMAYFVNDVLKS